MTIARPSARLRTTLRRLAALAPARRRDLAEATVSLALAALAIRLLPFRRLDRGLAAVRARSPVFSPADGESVRWAVEAMGRRVPWRTVCFQQGVAAHWMLRRRGIDSRLHYGVSSPTGEGQIAAHVWVTVGGAVLVGGDVSRFHCLKVYPREALPAALEATSAPS